MTVPSSVSRQDFVVDGVGPIDFPYRIDAPEELQLWVRSDDGLLKESQATYNVDYTVAVAGDFGSATATLSAQFAADNAALTCSLLRVLPLTQPLNVSAVQRFTDGAIESGFDRTSMRDQQLAEEISEAHGLALSLALGTLPSAFIQTLLDDLDAAAARATMGLRTVLNQDTTITVGPGQDFETLQEAWNYVCGALDLQGFVVTLQLMDGTHTSGVNDYLPDPRVAQTYHGGGVVKIRGNSAAPQNVIVTSDVATLWFVNSYVYLEYFEVRCTDPSLAGITAAWRGVIELGEGMRLGACTAEKLHASSGGQIRALFDYTDVGNANGHVFAGQGGQVRVLGKTITHVGTPAYTEGYAIVGSGGLYDARGTIYSGACTGPEFALSPGGIILRDTNNLFDIPGNAAGTLPAGALYDEHMGPDPTEIASGSFPAAAVLDIPIPVWARRLYIHVEGVSCGTATRHPIVLASIDNGSTFPATDYTCFGLSATPAMLTGAALIDMVTNVAAARSWDFDGVIEGVYGGGLSARFHGATDDFSAGIISAQSFNAVLDGRVTHLRFAWSGSGNHDGGTYSVRATG